MQVPRLLFGWSAGLCANGVVFPFENGAQRARAFHQVHLRFQHMQTSPVRDFRVCHQSEQAVLHANRAKANMRRLQPADCSGLPSSRQGLKALRPATLTTAPRAGPIMQFFRHGSQKDNDLMSPQPDLGKILHDIFEKHPSIYHVLLAGWRIRPVTKILYGDNPCVPNLSRV